MKIIFNLLLFIPLLVELNRAMHPVKAWGISKRLREAKEENPDTYSDTVLGGPDGDTLKIYILSFVIILLGLLSSQWVIFLIHIIFDIICNQLRIQRLIPGVFINASVGVLLIGFAMINGLHLHYDIFHILISMF